MFLLNSSDYVLEELFELYFTGTLFNGGEAQPDSEDDKVITNADTS